MNFNITKQGVSSTPHALTVCVYDILPLILSPISNRQSIVFYQSPETYQL